jgi:uncharacterized membrane protein YedE/YeeE
MKQLGYAFICGCIFAFGLVLSGMTQPDKILNFLDILGTWDPTLGFVMLGAIAVHAPLRLKVLKSSQPSLASAFEPPPSEGVTLKLLTGAVLFGVGWGLSGFCPGPAIASVATESPNAIPFVMAMVVGMTLVRMLSNRASRS